MPPARSWPLARLRGPSFRLPAAGGLLRARQYATRALAIAPRNPLPLKNLGAIFGQQGGSLRAFYYLRRSNECDPQDPQTVYGLAFAYMELGRHRAGFKRIEPGMDIGVDLGEEWGMAEMLAGEDERGD